MYEEDGEAPKRKPQYPKVFLRLIFPDSPNHGFLQIYSEHSCLTNSIRMWSQHQAETLAIDLFEYLGIQNNYYTFILDEFKLWMKTNLSDFPQTEEDISSEAKKERKILSKITEQLNALTNK